MERTDQIIELISKANQSFDSGVIRDGQKLSYTGTQELQLILLNSRYPECSLRVLQITNYKLKTLS